MQNDRLQNDQLQDDRSQNDRSQNDRMHTLSSTELEQVSGGGLRRGLHKAAPRRFQGPIPFPGPVPLPLPLPPRPGAVSALAEAAVEDSHRLTAIRGAALPARPGGRCRRLTWGPAARMP